MTKRKLACEKVVPHYWHRSTANKPVKKSARKATPAKEYPRGYFTEFVVQHNWPPRFESRAWAGSEKVTPEPHRHGGFDRNPLGLPGAAAYVRMFEAQAAARKAKA